VNDLPKVVTQVLPRVGIEPPMPPPGELDEK